MIGRRGFLAGGVALIAACATAPIPAPKSRLETLRARLGPEGRLGVAAVDTGSGRRFELDAGGRYAMCSTFKLPLAATVLAQADRGTFSLEDQIRFSEADLLDYAPVTRAALPVGRLSVRQLCAAVIEVSDNTAANLLLGRIGGPEGLTHFMRACGDDISRLDRSEPELNSNLPGDVRDTTTPAAMLALMEAILTGKVLKSQSLTQLLTWLEGATTGLDRLRAGLPAGWRAGDKTGTGANGAHCDVAIAWPPGRRPILIASYQSGGTAAPEERNAVHADVARIVSASLGPSKA